VTTTVLITGFGPFPGAPFNPTEPLALRLGRRRLPTDVRRVVHVFRVSYEAVDRELPALIERERPDALIMFGLATRTDHVRIETRARNGLNRVVPDAGGYRPVTAMIDGQAPAVRPFRGPTLRLLMAARATGVPAALSHDAGRYLCNYLCWRAVEAARHGGPRLAAFIHVPAVRRQSFWPTKRRHLTFDQLAAAAEAIVRTATLAARQAGRAELPPRQAAFEVD
jgi:pyroglutamyl-peptidase